MGFDEDELDEDLDDESEESSEKTPEPEIDSKTPSARTVPGGKKISVFFMSTIGPGEKKQKMVVDTGNIVESIKQTVGNLFGLDPADFHLSSGGITLTESDSLLDYNIADGDDILLIPASTAG